MASGAVTVCHCHQQTKARGGVRLGQPGKPGAGLEPGGRRGSANSPRPGADPPPAAPRTQPQQPDPAAGQRRTSTEAAPRPTSRRPSRGAGAFGDDREGTPMGQDPRPTLPPGAVDSHAAPCSARTVWPRGQRPAGSSSAEPRRGARPGRTGHLCSEALHFRPRWVRTRADVRAGAGVGPLPSEQVLWC